MPVCRYCFLEKSSYAVKREISIQSCKFTLIQGWLRRKKRPSDESLFLFLCLKDGLCFLRNNTLFFDTCLLTCERTEVVQLSATYLTYLVHFDAFDAW